MKIHSKILVLLLAIALIPLLVGTVFESFSALQLSRKLTSDTREQLLNNAFTMLSTLVDEYGQILKRDEAQILLSLNFQAREVERLLSTNPKSSQPLYFSTDFDHPEKQPADTEPSEKHFRPSAAGTLEPIPVNYNQQVIYLPQGIQRQDVSELVQQLGPLPDVYRLVHDIRPDLFLWQYTTLEKGIHSSYPGKGGYPPEYDPRQRDWYIAAKSEGKAISRVITDLSTRSLILTMAMPVHTPDGKFAGVTAIDVIYQWLLNDWTIPAEWRDMSRAMILLFHPVDSSLEVVYRDDQSGQRNNWQVPVKRQFLKADVAEQLESVFADLRAGRSGIRKISQQGEAYLWTYGQQRNGQPFPLISVPYQQVVAQATRAESYARDQAYWTLKISGLILITVILIVLYLAFKISSALTRPVLQLVDAAKRFSQEKFDVQVNINTGDELQDLGSAFNAMGISLLERQQMKQSMALAHEVQQHLLPEETPELKGFDIVGYSRYCDETGGDYYDYLSLGNEQLGLAVADVTGHGIGAALLMTTVRGIFRAQGPLLGANPEELLLSLNRHLARDTRDDFFVTFFYTLLDAKKRHCHWLSAGHGPSFYYSASTQTVRELPSSGIPLGILDSISFDKVETLSMESGDILLIGTDGLWEAPSLQGELYGTSRISQVLLEHAAESATDICHSIFTALGNFCRSDILHDDQTMLIIKAN
ncbi:SpoIIE family protein phosphatase [Malonomonas rubra]|uniref:SpoIIE family protein phosphatase n=1 Tax=Malonomonas rubra TaxID=57040 RepID=UPI0026EC5CB7|nr:SpoIIE family protein phosphatase [Malonomonas rubra]